jgi:hypothetical protein
MRRNLKSNKTVLVDITKILKPNMRFQEHGPKKTLENTGCPHSFVIVNKFMLRQCPPSNNNTRNGTNFVFQTAELQRYSELLRNEDRSDTAIKNTTDNNNTTSTFVSRVLEDVSHLIDIIKVPIKHTLCSEFMTKLRDIFLVPDPVDKFNISRVLLSTEKCFGCFQKKTFLVTII